jgi:DNA-binding response OmpR family regulator
MQKVLMAEDESVLRKVLKERFEQDGWEVVSCSNGEEAINAIEKSKDFDLILLDIVMPKKDGFDALKVIRDNAEFEEVPIIMLSNLGSDDDIKQALSLGANDYFVKSQHPMGEIVEKAHKYMVEGHKPKGRKSYISQKEAKDTKAGQDATPAEIEAGEADKEGVKKKTLKELEEEGN